MAGVSFLAPTAPTEFSGGGRLMLQLSPGRLSSFQKIGNIATSQIVTVAFGQADVHQQSQPHFV